MCAPNFFSRINNLKFLILFLTKAQLALLNPRPNKHSKNEEQNLENCK